MGVDGRRWSCRCLLHRCSVSGSLREAGPVDHIGLVRRAHCHRGLATRSPGSSRWLKAPEANVGAQPSAASGRMRWFTPGDPRYRRFGWIADIPERSLPASPTIRSQPREIPASGFGDDVLDVRADRSILPPVGITSTAEDHGFVLTHLVMDLPDWFGVSAGRPHGAGPVVPDTQPGHDGYTLVVFSVGVELARLPPFAIARSEAKLQSSRPNMGRLLRLARNDSAGNPLVQPDRKARRESEMATAGMRVPYVNRFVVPMSAASERNHRLRLRFRQPRCVMRRSWI